MKPRIFISAVTSEFGTSRQLVANVLSRLGYDPVWQDIFGTESGDLRQVLREKIDDCDGLIQLVGRCYGAEPPTVDAEFGRVSYTQFEFLYARARGKKTWLIFADEGCTRDRPLDELDLPRTGDERIGERGGVSPPVVAMSANDAASIRPDSESQATAYQAERRALQEAWQQRWKRESHLFHGVASDIDLELRVERMRDEFAELRREFRWWQQSVTRNLTIVAALALVSVGVGMYVARQQQQAVGQVDQAQKEIEHKIESTAADTKEGIKAAVQEVAKELANPSVLADRIRKEIHATAESKIQALPDAKGRGRLVAEIEKERDLALGRVDDLIKLIQEGLKEGASPVFQRAAEILQKEGTDAAIEYLESRRPSTLETARRHAEQAKTAQARADAEKELRNKSLQALVLEAELLEMKLQWQPVIELREQVAELAPDWFDARNRLGTLHLRLARYAIAEPHLQAAMKLAANPAEEAVALNNLGQLFESTNRLNEAEPLMRRSLTISEQFYGAEHLSVAIDLNNIAGLLKVTNRLAEAEPLMRRALAISEKFYGAENPLVATNLSNLALLLQATNRLAEAEPLMYRALILDEQFYGAEHPQVARDLNNLALLLNDTNRSAEAEPLIRRALTINEQSFGTEHPDVASILNNLAKLLIDTNRSAEAEPLIRRALAINEQSNGAEHPNVAINLTVLARSLQATNRLEKAEPLIRHAIAIAEQNYGAEHDEVACSLHCLAELLKDTNRLELAEPLMRRPVTILHLFRLRNGHEHPHMQAVLASYRDLLQSMKFSQDEAVLRVQALHTSEPLKPIAPEVERLLGPSDAVAEVLAALDRQNKVNGKPAVYFLSLREPIAPYLNELLNPTLDSLKTAGVAAYLERDWPSTIVLCDEWLKRLGDNHDNEENTFFILALRASARRELGDIEHARDVLRNLLSETHVGPNISALFKGLARHNLALCEWRLGNLEAAQRESEAALKEYDKVPATRFAFKKPSPNESEIPLYRDITERMLADLRANQQLPPLDHVDLGAVLENARVRFQAREALATLPLNQSAVPLLDQMLGPAKSPQEVFETLDRQYREQNKSAIWFLPLSQPIAPHLDELLGPLPAKE